MPVWLDAIPEKAPKVMRPNPRRWLLFLALMLVAGITLRSGNGPQVEMDSFSGLLRWGYHFVYGECSFPCGDSRTKRNR